MDMKKVVARATVESDIADAFVKQVKGYGGWAIRFWPITLAGFPDWIVLWKGARIDFVELKRPGKKPGPLQKAIHRRLFNYGFIPLTLSTFDQVIEYVDSRATP